MTGALHEDIAAAARNRGLRLVRSRVRTPGKAGFGKVGLVDKSLKPLFGIEDGQPAASLDDVATYLRGLEAKDWGESLGGGDRPRKKLPRARPKAAGPIKAAPPPKPNTEEPKVRAARSTDAPALVELVHELGAESNEAQIRANLGQLKKSGETPLVATLAGDVVGLCGLGRRIAVHRPAPIGRITVLVVKEEVQGLGIGRLLVEAAERWMRQSGCYLAEVTSNDRRADAHAFYRHLGYDRTSIRFAKDL